MLIKNEYKPQMLIKNDKKKKPTSKKSRLGLVLFCFMAFYAAVALRGVYLQTEKQEFLQEQGNQRFVRTIPLYASRGLITDRNGTAVAISAPTQSLYASPRSMEHLPTAEQLSKLSVLTGLSVEYLDEKLNQKNKDFVYIKRHLPKEVSDQVAALGLKGFGFQQESKRHYPMGNVFSHVIGFANIDGQGQEGLELSQNKLLLGKDGGKVVLRDNKGNIVDSIDSPRNQAPIDGQNMVLSMDQRIQSLAYDSLEKAVLHHQAKSGSAVILDAKTGEILALTNYPSFDSNNPAKANVEYRRNRAVTDMIEPGSIMKPFPIAKALDAGKVRANTVLNTAPYMIGPARVKDTHDYGSLTVEGVMQKSSNVGSSKLSAMFSPEEMYDYYSQVGFGQQMHSGFPGESKGLLRHWKGWRPIEQATMSYGYGLQMSLLQLARGYTIFTTNGQLLPVSFKRLDAAPVGDQVISPETAKVIRQIMVSVTEKGGTGTRGAVDGYDVAAKSGTARKLVGGRYVANKHTGLFAGFAPAMDPRIIVAVMIDEPTANGYYGGVVAGPLFGEIMNGSLSILGVAPTKEFKKTDNN